MTTAPAIHNTLAHPRCPIRKMGRSPDRQRRFTTTRPTRPGPTPHPNHHHTGANSVEFGHLAATPRLQLLRQAATRRAVPSELLLSQTQARPALPSTTPRRLEVGASGRRKHWLRVARILSPQARLDGIFISHWCPNIRFCTDANILNGKRK